MDKTAGPESILHCIAEYTDHEVHSKLFIGRFIFAVPTVWGKVTLAITVRLVEGVAAGMFVTAAYTMLPQLFPGHISTLMVCTKD